MIDHGKRGSIRKLLASIAGFASVASVHGQTSAEEEDAREVAKLYSTKPIRVKMQDHQYVIPANYFSPKGRDEPDEMDAPAGFGFFLFLPDYNGYTQENWRNQFIRRLIQVVDVNPDARYHKSEIIFESMKRSLEPAPSVEAHGLKGHFWRNRQNRGVYWIGRRSNGEFFLLQTSLAPGEQPPDVDFSPTCRTGYFSDAEGLFISYHYSQDHMAQWRQIDDAIWAKLHSWRTA